jgi:DNA-directed RNA polymerase subunit L
MLPRNVEIQSAGDKKAVIDIAAYPTPLVNAVRRSILNHVRSVAMVSEPASSSSIRIINNTSRLNNQFLALRISLIPVCLPPPEHSGEINVLDRYEVRISKKATEPGVVNLTTDDIRIYDTKERGFLPSTIVKQMFPPEIVEYPGLTNNRNPFLIVPLKGPHGEKEGESVDIVAKLKVGVGSVHACFVPVCNCTYEILPMDPEAPSATLDAMGKGDRSLFRFVVETVTNRNPEVLFLEGIDEMIRKLVNVRTNINTASKSKGKGPNCEIHTDLGDVVFRFMNEDHTLGTLFQEYLLRKIKEDDPDAIGDWFVGYRIPHPLTPEMIVRVHIPDKLVDTDSNVTMNTLVNTWVLPAIVNAENDLKDIGERITRLIPEERRTHPLAMLLNDDYVPAVERPTVQPKDDTGKKPLLENVREPISPPMPEE